MKDNLFGNKRVLTIGAIVLGALAVIVGGVLVALQLCDQTEVYSGYLICQNCGVQGTCMDSNLDLTAHPEQYTLACAKMPECIVSGYGLAMAQADGDYKYYTFDEAGSELALKNVIYMTPRANNLFVEVKGTMRTTDEVIEVESIVEK